MKATRSMAFIAMLFATAAVSFAGAQREEGPAAESEAPGVRTGKYQEAPMLRELVQAGKLPPVDERLPKEPKVVANNVELPAEWCTFEIGHYGDVFRIVTLSADWSPVVFVGNNEPLVSVPGVVAIDRHGVMPNVAGDFTASADNRVFTFTLREGLKWSDGAPVTTEDVRFAYEDFQLDEKLTPLFPNWLRSGNTREGEPVRMEILDRYTFRMSFDEPYGGFLGQLALTSWRGYSDLLKPKHYLMKYHPNHTTMEELGSLIEEEEIAEGEWWSLFNLKDITNWESSSRDSVGFPCLYPWLVTGSTMDVTRLERNPYYFKVDPEGKQLPYVDRIRMQLVQNMESVNLKLIAGEVDLNWLADLPKVPLYKEAAKKAGIRTLLLNLHTVPSAVVLNLTHPDPVWRQLVRDVRFRRALNMGLNKREIIESIHLGFGSLPETVPSVFDPDRAEQILDEVGLDKRDSDGWRLGPDGKRFVIPFVVANWVAEIVPSAEITAEQWKELGVFTSLRVIDPGLYGTSRAANEIKALTHRVAQPMWRTGGWLDYLPSNLYGPLWDVWYRTGGAEGEEPPAEVKRLYEISEKVVTLIPGTKEYNALYDEMEQIMYDNIFLMLAVEKAKQPMIMNAGLANIPQTEDANANSMLFASEQIFFK